MLAERAIHYQSIPVSSYVASSPARSWYERGSETNLLTEEAYRFAKRAIDIIVSIVALPAALAVMALCIIAIKLDSPGPAFFMQPRTGRGGRAFGILKLRTMIENAAELRDKYLHLNELVLPDFKITNDPRMTPVGRFLRKLSLDELPQIFNVLAGDMSLVGPRPSSYGANTYKLWQTARFTLKPGITGLAQICGRSELRLDQKVRFDIIYQRNHSLWLDVQILLRTVGVVMGGRGVK